MIFLVIQKALSISGKLILGIKWLSKVVDYKSTFKTIALLYRERNCVGDVMEKKRDGTGREEGGGRRVQDGEHM